jgi:methionyl-tRNA synthetase
MSKNTFYVTTPIYYVNAKPHVGTLYSTLIADVLARWNRMKKKEVFFLTGTDEHGQKIAQEAEKAGKDPQTFVDQVVPAFKDAWQRYNLSYDHFVRTTDFGHRQTVSRWIEKLLEQGDIYKASYEGWYCVPCETFIPLEKISDSDGEQAACPSCEREVKRISEENYFFRLSAYQDKLLAFYKEHPDFIFPKERANEILSFVSSGLKDLSISRMSVDWGISFPHDDTHTVYVWGDALMNYLSALGYLQGSDETFEKFWPADVHVMAKDIVRFHAVYFPAFLMAVGLPLPKQLLVHGYLLVDDAKMSKSKGNAYDPMLLADTFGEDQIRFYLMRHMTTTHDGNMSIPDMVQRIESDLANALGNLLQRTASLAAKYDAEHVAPPHEWSEPAEALRVECGSMLERFATHMDGLQIAQAYAEVWHFIGRVNAFFHEQEPWKKAKNDPEAFAEVIAASTQALYAIAHVIHPVMPTKSHQLLAALGHTLDGAYADVSQNRWNVSCTLFVRKEPLFARPELPEWYHTSVDVSESLQNDAEEEKKEMTTESTEKPAEVKKEAQNEEYVTIDTFAAVHLVAGTIVSCEPVKKSKKMLHMHVDLGAYGMRTICAGVAEYFSPETLVGKRGTFVANLPPRPMMGLVSQGMMLVAKDGEKMSLVSVDEGIANGTRLG